MGTNYYARGADTAADDEGLHIGKSSAGWDFLFRAHRDMGLTDCEAWKQYLTQPGVQIFAEYGYTVNFDEFWADAVKRPASYGNGQQWRMKTHDSEWRARRGHIVNTDDHQWTDDHGHPFSAREFC